MKARRHLLVGSLVVVLGGLLFASGTPLAFAVGEGLNSPMDYMQAQTPSSPYTFNTLIKAFKYTGLDVQYAGKGPFTIMAPTDAAFGALPSDMLNQLITNKTYLTNVLKYHAIVGKAIPIKTLLRMKTAQTAQGGILKFDTTFAQKMGSTGQGQNAAPPTGTVHYTVDGVIIVQPDVPVKNGLIDVIGAVLFP